MAMRSFSFKEHEGIVQNSVGQLSSTSSGAWWNAFGPRSVYGESYGPVRSFSLELPNYVDQLAATPNKPAGRGAEQLFDKGHTTKFTIFPDDCTMTGDAQKPHTAISLQSSVPDPRARFELAFSQPMICAKYPYMDQFYGLFSAYGPQVSGRIMLPLNLTSDDGPIYVNAKQYHGIIRRRQSRAKAVLENKATKRCKPYMHESRHLHAMRRPRGSGGRFLNTRTTNLSNENGESRGEVNRTGKRQLQSSGSPSSEVLQSECGTLNSSKETSGGSPNISGSEVTSSVYSRGGLDSFTFNHLGSTVHSLADMLDSGRGIVMPTKWVAAGGNCCNLNV